MNLSGLIKIGIIAVAVIIGAPFGELSEYILWSVGDYAISHCVTQNLSPGWYDQCIKNLGNYNDYKPYFQLSGSIVGLIIGMSLARKVDFG